MLSSFTYKEAQVTLIHSKFIPDAVSCKSNRPQAVKDNSVHLDNQAKLQHSSAVPGTASLPQESQRNVVKQSTEKQSEQRKSSKLNTLSILLLNLQSVYYL